MAETFSPEAVFVTDGFPEYTYVPQGEGKQEAALKDGLGQKNKIISIAGPSKSGKTTLCNQVFGTEKGIERIYLTGDSLQKPDDLWYEAYRQVTDDTEKEYYDLSQGQRLDALIKASLPLIIDDYHYIPSELQKTIARQIKNAASQGLRIICLSVPHRGDDPIRNNPDLSGRCFSINFDFWSDDDLIKIPLKGFKLVEHPIQDAFNRALSTQALRSPQIMQTLCLEACRIHGSTPLKSIVPSVDRVPEIIERTVRSYNNSTGLDVLRNGPATRGSARNEYATVNNEKLDVYQCLVQAFKKDPPFQWLALDDIRERVRSLLKRDEEPGIRAALQQYPDLFEKPPLDWDDEKRRLTVVDPHFYFYLRNSKS